MKLSNHRSAANWHRDIYLQMRETQRVVTDEKKTKLFQASLHSFNEINEALPKPIFVPQYASLGYLFELEIFAINYAVQIHSSSLVWSDMI